MIEPNCILFSSYLPPIQYFTKFLLHENFIIEKHEHFPKQTFRNRCNIYCSNGLLSLFIPIKHDASEHVKIKDVRISYDSSWQKIHWRSIETAYRSSAFFEYYEDAFKPFFHEKKPEFLFEFNQGLTEIILKNLKIRPSLSFTEKYQKEYPAEYVDLRNSIHPKKIGQDPHFSQENYFQVFQNKHGFLPNLSIIDLLFNEGPNSSEYLKNCVS